MLRSIGNSPKSLWSQSWRRTKERLRWKVFAENEGFKPGERRRSDDSGDNDEDDDINFVLIHSSVISQILSTTFRVILLTNKQTTVKYNTPIKSDVRNNFSELFEEGRVLGPLRIINSLALESRNVYIVNVEVFCWWRRRESVPIGDGWWQRRVNTRGSVSRRKRWVRVWAIGRWSTKRSRELIPEERWSILTAVSFDRVA